MAKKRKSDTRLDEVDRSMYTSFCTAANSLSQLYTHSMNQQKLSFHAGERHALEKLYDWILRRQEGGSRVNTLDIVTYLQNELEYGLEETPMHSTNIGVPGHLDHQAKNSSVFSNALSSPVRQCLQQYHLSSNVMPSGNGARNTETTYSDQQIRDSNTPNVNDSLMDMHAESPGHQPSF